MDDHPLVREWLAALIGLQGDLKVCGEADNARDGLRDIIATRPHLAIVDISMDGGSGIELIRNLKADCPEVATIVLSVHAEALYCERALRAGARGYVMKRESTKTVLHAIRQVLDGKLYLSGKMTVEMAGRCVGGKLPAASHSPTDVLSNRELEVFQLLGRGYSTRQIGEDLQISFKTVQAFCARIKEKLVISCGTDLLREAVRWDDDRNLKHSSRG